MFGFTRVASQNLTRAFKPRRSLCKLENNNCTNANKYSKCSQILERDECESGWKWLNCRRPVVSECYWEADRCTSVSDRNGDDDICPAITNQQDCEDKFWFKNRPTSSASCYWKESEGTSSCAVDRENLEDLDNLDPRVCQELAHVALIQGVCNESQILTGDTCLAIIARDKVNNGKLKDDIVSGCRTELRAVVLAFFLFLTNVCALTLCFFCITEKKYANSLDMLALATYIYEFAALKDLAWKNHNFTLVSKLQTLPMDLLRVASYLKDNLGLM